MKETFLVPYFLHILLSIFIRILICLGASIAFGSFAWAIFGEGHSGFFGSTVARIADVFLGPIMFLFDPLHSPPSPYVAIAFPAAFILSLFIWPININPRSIILNRNDLAWLCVALLGIGWIGLSIHWYRVPESCYETDGLDKIGIQPVFQSGTVKGNAVRITRVDAISGYLLSNHSDADIILEALTKGGFEWIELSMRRQGSWQGYAPFRTANFLQIAKEISSLPENGQTKVIKYYLTDRVGDSCLEFDRYIEGNVYINTNKAISLAQGRCITYEYVEPTAPIEIVYSVEKRQVSRPSWIFPPMVTASKNFHNWNRIQILDARSGMLIANHYDSVFGGKTVHGGSTSGCFNNKAKYEILTSTIFSDISRPFIFKGINDQ